MRALALRIISDTVGFVGGALLGYWLMRAFGIDLLHDSFSQAHALALAAVGLGGGIGLGAARRQRQHASDPHTDHPEH